MAKSGIMCDKVTLRFAGQRGHENLIVIVIGDIDWVG